MYEEIEVIGKNKTWDLIDKSNDKEICVQGKT